jgi:uncharacterized protein YcbX
VNPVAKIARLARYPVKSMRGERLDLAPITFQGVAEDRRYAFVQKASRSSFPWLTARQRPELLLYRTAVEGAGSDAVAVTVTTPQGETWPVESDELRREIEARSGQEVFLLRDYRGSYDVAPISLISRQTVVRIAEESGTHENAWRFRPNLLIDLEEGGQFAELKWVGRVLRIGGAARVAITEVNQRCMIINLDPDTVSASPSVLRNVTQQHEQCAGVYGTVLTAGEVCTGDPVWLEG